MNRPELFRLARVVAAIFLVVSGVRHVVLAVEGDPSVPRHWLFVGINLGLALLLVRWPKAALYATALLSIQQMASHGTALVRSIEAPGPVDVASLAVCLFFPALIAILVVERRSLHIFRTRPSNAP